MSEEIEHHGDSPAAWTAVIIGLIAVTSGTVGLFIEHDVLIWGSVGLFVFAFVLGFILSKMGYGINGPKFVPKHKD